MDSRTSIEFSSHDPTNVGIRSTANRVSTSTYDIGAICELSERMRTSYYCVAGQRIAMRAGAPGTAGTLTYLHGDHLGSTSLATDELGEELYRRGYYPFGEERYATGVAQTDYGFTGQREEAYIDLIEMGARWYHSALGRWISADTIVPDPGNPQGLNRFSYVYNNPLRYSDPSGHKPGWGGLVPYDVMTGPNGAAIAREAGQLEYHPDFNPYGRTAGAWGLDTPTVIGYQIAVQGEMNAHVGMYESFSAGVYFNWWSGQLSWVTCDAEGSNIDMPAPSIVAGSVSLEGVVGWNYSDNEYLGGVSKEYQGSLKADAWATFGIQGTYSPEMEYKDGSLEPFIDPVSDRQAALTSFGFNAGGNMVATGGDGSYSWGKSDCHVWLTVDFY